MMQSHNNTMKRPVSTDAFTKGGQIFGHVWRMRVQNAKLLSNFWLVSFAVLLAPCLLLFGVGWYLWWDIFCVSYVGGIAKLLLWPLVQVVLLGCDDIAKTIWKGSSGFPIAHQGVETLVTTFAMNGKLWAVQTLTFVKSPWTQTVLLPVFKGLYTTMAASLVLPVLMLLHFRSKTRNIEDDRILKGQSLVTPDVLKKLIKGKGMASHLTIAPDLPMVKDSEVEHTIIVGATRMGKTNCVLGLLKQVRQTGGRAVVLDLTGELTQAFYRPGQDVLLNPFDARSNKWNLWGENLLPHEYDAFAASVVPSGHSDPIWHETARKLLSVTAEKLSKVEGKGLQDILSMSCWRPLDQEVQKFYKNTSLASLMTKESERTSSSVRMNLSSSIDCFKDLDACKGTPVAITEWVAREDEDSWLFLMALPSERATLAPILASWCSFAFLGLERLGASFTRRLWFVVDEFPGLGQKIDALPRMVAEGAKYGACCVLSFQSKAQLDHIYSSNVTRTILSNCSTKVIFRTPETDTARYLSGLLGKQDLLEATESISMGAHHLRDGVSLSGQLRTKLAVSELDIISLAKRQAFVMLPGSLPITKVEYPITEIGRVA